MIIFLTQLKDKATYIAKLWIASPGAAIQHVVNGIKSSLIMFIISKLMTSKILTDLSSEAEHRNVPL